MRTFSLVAFFLLLGLFGVSPVAADQADDCVALVEKGLALIKEKGREEALNAINNSDGPFVKGELYLFALTMDNVLVGQPHEKLLRRMNMSNVQDAAGRYFFKMFKEIAQNPGQGWVEYTWAKPGEKNASKKKSFIKKVPGEDLYIGAGYYLQ